MRRIAILFASLLSAGVLLGSCGQWGANATTPVATFTATTHMTNRLDGGHNTLGGGVWATDTMNRTATLSDLGADPHNSLYEDYTFSLSDAGTFVTNSNVGNPNGLNPTTPITGTVTGSISGSGQWGVFAVLKTDVPDAGLVPASTDGNGTSSSQWPSLFFKDGAKSMVCAASVLPQVESVQTVSCGEDTYSYTYKSCSEQWVDANTDNDGDAATAPESMLAIIGGISGKACPTPTPTPTSTTPPPSTGGNGVPSGGVQTGGGLPHSDPTGQIIGVGLLVFGLCLTVGYTLRKVARNR